MQTTQQTSGQQLRAALKAAKLTQKQLAMQYDIPLRTIEDWCSDRRTPGYVLNLLMRCMEIDFPATKVLSEQPASEPVYTFTDKYGKPLSPKLAEHVRTEFLADRVQPQDEYVQDSYGEDVPTANRRGKLYQCTSTDLDSDISFAFEFRVKKEV